MTSPCFYTIPAGVPFADALAAGIMAQAGDDPAALTAYKIMLPTRRACRNLRDAFLRLAGGKPLLLPQLLPLGEGDEDELALAGAFAEEGDLPPAIAPLRRRLLLAKLVMKLPDYEDKPDGALAVAAELARLMDQIHTEGLSMDDLATLVPEDYAAHWNITLEFLKILSAAWPEILAAEGVIDGAVRRDKLIRARARFWAENPPQTPIIAAGSTGSIPATSALLRVIAGLPQGSVILPGLDRAIDDESWAALEDSHPQATLRNLLKDADIERHAVEDWPYTPPADLADEPPGLAARKDEMRRWLARETMRPAATAEAWRKISSTLDGDKKDALSRSLSQVRRFDCDTAQEEANLIALLMRQSLETPGHRTTLVTPDRNLAQRVAATLRRWDIAVDDSAGIPLCETSAGRFLLLCAQAATDGLKPSSLLSLLRHDRVRLDENRAQILSLTEKAEHFLLRGIAPGPGFSGLFRRLDMKKNDGKDPPPGLAEFLQKLEAAFAPLLDLCEKENAPFEEFLTAHIALAETLAGGPDHLWRGEDGEESALFLSQLREEAALLPAMTGEDYSAVIRQLMSTNAVRPRYGLHPRLSILGQLEARLIQADLVILGGLNEGTWPPAPAADPWMSRPMRSAYGLPPPERGIGLAAHDFVQGFCAPHVVLTRALRAGNAPSVPARWLQRLDTVLAAAGFDPAAQCPAPYLMMARTLDHPGEAAAPVQRPAPTPPAEKRPTSLYVTAIEKLMRDPYSIYARYILKLRKLDALEKEPDAAQRGDIMHEALARFVTAHPDDLPDNAEEILLSMGRDAFGAHLDTPRLWAFWWPRFVRLAAWFVTHEKDWRKNAKPAAMETKGEAQIGFFTICAKADRIDILNDGSGAVIDYKTGGTPPAKAVLAGLAPQLPLEAFILAEGGFKDAGKRNPGYIGFWKLTGGRKAGEEVIIKSDDYVALAEKARHGLAGLVTIFADENTPYFSLPDPDRAPPAAWQDYAHLARVQEWAALGEDSADGEAA